MKPVFGPLPHHNSLSISSCMRLRHENTSRAGAFFTGTHAPGASNRSSTDKQKPWQRRQRLGAIHATNSCDARSAREHATWSKQRHRNAPFSGLNAQNTLQLKPWHVLASNKCTSPSLSATHASILTNPLQLFHNLSINFASEMSCPHISRKKSIMHNDNTCSHFCFSCCAPPLEEVLPN